MPRSPANIIVVDDDEMHREMIARHLRRGGISNPIVMLADGAAALDYVFGPAAHAQRRDTDLLMLLDINMPGLGGIEVLRRIKSNPDHQRLALMMLTTVENPREVEQCHEYGCDMYITKSVDPAKLIAAVERLLVAMQSPFVQADEFPSKIH